MIVYPDFAFASPPRTGGTWMMHASHDCGFGEGNKSKLHQPFPNDWNGFKVSLVRHPYNWLVSYHLALGGGWTGVSEIDALSNISRNNPQVDNFIRAYLRECPGQISKIFGAYNATTVIRLEDFPWGPLEFFQSLGVKIDVLSRISGQGAINARKNVSIPHRELRRQVVVAEYDFCERYEYFS